MATPEQALVHLAWRKEGKERRLVFGWAEIMPACFPPIWGHPFRSPKTRRDGPVLYVARFPMSAVEAERWFEAAAGGDLRLPVHPDRLMMGEHHSMMGPPFTREPENGGQSSSLALPFLPTIHGVMLTTGLFGRVDREFEEALLDGPDTGWLKDNIFFDLADYPEYVGSLLLVRHHPVVRDVGSRLQVKGGREIELVHIRRWPGTELDGHRVLALEQRVLGMGRLIETPVHSPLVVLDWHGKSDRTALSVIHEQHGLAWWCEPAGFLRSIQANIDLIRETRRIVQEVGEGGAILKSYDNHWRDTGHHAPSTSVGEDLDENAPSERARRSGINRERRRIAESLGLSWFDDADVAQEAVRAIIGRTRISFQVVDPYFGPGQIVDFVLAVSASDVAISIVTSAEHLLEKTQDGAERVFASMHRALLELRGKGWAEPEVLVMGGYKAPVHDRFLIADGRVWLTGNSLNAIGRRASVLVELPDPRSILAHLKPIVGAATPFPEWLAKRLGSGPRFAGAPAETGDEGARR